MAMKRTAEQAKQESENLILRQLTIKSPQRWSHLLNNTKISSRTLKKALDRLEKKGFVYRQVEQGKDYPPPVLYGLSLKGKEINDSMFFAINARPYVLGLELEWKAEGKKITIGIKKVGDIKERILLIGKRIAAFYLFTFLKGIEERNTEWINEANKLVDYDPFMISALDVADVKFQFTGEVESFRDQHLLHFLENQFTYDIERKKLIELKKSLKEVYPEEIKKFEKILKEGQLNVNNKKSKYVSSSK